MPGALKIIWYITLIALFSLLVATTVYLLIMKTPSSCASGCALAPPYMNGPQCLSVTETSSDATIPVPAAQPYLGSFKSAQGFGVPYCAPVWYAYRYVRNSDGQYGNMSPWTGPIYANSNDLPCPPAGCAAFGILEGNASCTFNSPTIVIMEPPTVPVNSAEGYTLNVHRQLGYFSGGQPTGFNASSTGSVVGSITVIPGLNGVQGTFVDTMNPNSTQLSTCC